MQLIKSNKYYQFIIWSLITSAILLTNEYFSLEEVFKNGAVDGKVYFSISQYAPGIAENLIGHKAWRFFYPYLIGVINKTINFDIFLFYQLSVILIIFNIIYILNNKFFSQKFFENFIFICCIIFNPYFFRYFISLPLLINDLIFIYGTIYLVFFLKKNKFKHLIIAIIIVSFARQESIFILMTILLCKIIYRKHSLFDYKQILILSVISGIIFYINTYYSMNSSSLKFVDAYSDGGRIGILNFTYSFTEFVKFLFYFIFPFSLIIILVIFNYKKIIKNFKSKFKEEKIVFILILSALVLAPAIVAGPEISGKNILRLTNLPMMLIVYLVSLLTEKIKTNRVFVFIFFGAIFILLQHPKYSQSNLFNFLIN